MLKININYKPFWMFSGIKQLQANLPIRWSELTEKQFLAVPLFHKGLLTDLAILKVFLNLRTRAAKGVTADQLNSIKMYLKFTEEPEPLTYFVIKKALWFNAPEPQLNNVPFRAFILGLGFYQNYLKGRRHDLDRLIACFYFKKSAFFNPQKYIKSSKVINPALTDFDESLIDHDATIIRAENIMKREAISINFDMILEWIGPKYTYVFHESEKIMNLDKTISQPTSLEKIIFDFNIDIKDYQNRPVCEVLGIMNERLREHNRMFGTEHPLSEEF
jgi:hypothetical protein